MLKEVAKLLSQSHVIGRGDVDLSTKGDLNDLVLVSRKMTNVFRENLKKIPEIAPFKSMYLNPTCELFGLSQI